VATNGDNSTGQSWTTAFTTIQAAVDTASTDPNAVTIIVGSAGGHGDGNYSENIDISFDNLTLESESGYQHTFLDADLSNDHAITITGDFVTVRGFSISGATATGIAGIYLSGANSCLIENNRCGWMDVVRFRNYRGIS